MTQPLQPSSSSSDVKMLINDQYFTFRKIGQGGFGAVWRAYDFSLRNFVAVKELLREYSEIKYVEMFYKEALIAKNLIHDNIVRVQHFWKGSNGSYYILMDFVRGSDLEHIIKRCNSLQIKLPWELSVLICSSILKALDYANRIAKDTISGKPYGIVYRDISPGNVIISFEGNVKLSDFGIAKTAEELHGGVKQRVVTGKYGYMSPEQIQGSADIDHRSDIYSIGVVLYEMLSGVRLYEGTNNDIKTQVLQKQFDPGLLAGLNLPDELIEVVVKALEKQPELRYEKAIEMFRDLRRLLKGKETEELTVELSDFVASILTAEMDGERKVTDYVKYLNLQDIKSDPTVVKVMCKDFIVGDQSDVVAVPAPVVVVAAPAPAASPAPAPVTINPSAPFAPPVVVRPVPPGGQPPPTAVPRNVPPPAGDVPYRPVTVSPPPVRPPTPVPPPPPPPTPVAPAPHPSIERGEYRGEEKGKTVFEEVGDWLVTRFKVYRRRFIRVTAAVVFATLLFGLIDTFTRITPFGRLMYSRLYPPDVVITTVPAGATVTMKTRDGKVVLSNTDSTRPIELRDIPPKTYLITAMKDGFRPVERIVKIEDQDKDSRLKAQQKIEIFFDFTLEINSTPDGADIYVDGNKFKTTPWQGQLPSGEHTVKLSLPGFDDLGSVAKETKEGQCNIDLTRATLMEMFNGVDTKHWKYEMTTSSGMTVFRLTAQLSKKVRFVTNPIGMMVQLGTEPQPRGQTPLTVPFRVGDYTVRFWDQANRYAEESRTISVTRDSPAEVQATLNKWVSFKVVARDNPGQNFSATVRIAGEETNVTRELESNRPVRIALPVRTYRVSFVGGQQFKPLVLTSVDIENRAAVTGELEYNNPIIKVSARVDGGAAVPDAYVWVNGTMSGKTGKAGQFETSVNVGTSTVRLIAKGYVESSVEQMFQPGQTYELPFLLVPEAPVEVSSATAAQAGGGVRPAAEPARPAASRPQASPASGVADAAPAKPEEKIVCANCGKEYIVGPKKLRFCTNCGKPFR